jgi:hypothetical protein
MTSRVLVPINALAPATLASLVEEFVSRDGTDYGDIEVPLESRVKAVHQALERGDVALVFDIESEQHDIIAKDYLAQWVSP